MAGASEAMRSLGPFVGLWNTEGRIRAGHDAGGQTMVATDTYEWLPGKCFLLHRVDARMGNDITRSTEIIGWDADAAQLFSTSYDAKGGISHFICALKGQDWKIDGAAIRFRGGFDPGWTNLTGTWEMETNGSWTPWLDIWLTRAD